MTAPLLNTGITAINSGLAMQNTTANGGTVNPNQSGSMGVSSTAPKTVETSTNPSDPNATMVLGSPNTTLPKPPNSNPTTYPVVTSGAATNDVNNMQGTANTLSGQVANQTVSNATNSANNTQSKTNIPAGWDAQTYANFKAANPGLEPTAQDTAKMQGAGQTSPSGATNDNSDLTSALTAATNAITPPDQATYDKEEAGYSQNEADVQGQLDDVQSQMTSAANNFQNSISQLMNGTFPLSPQQTALVQQMQSANQGLIQGTQLATQNYLNAVKSYGITTGLNMYSPVLALGQINQATQEANAKVASVEQQGVKALADLQNSFQTQDFNLMSKSYDTLQNSLDEKDKTLTDLSTKVMTMAQDATKNYNDQVKEYQTQVQDAVTNALKSSELDESSRHNLATEAVSQGTLEEKTANDAIVQGQNAQKIAISGERAKIALLQLQQSTDANTSAVVNATTHTISGIPYVDGSNLTAEQKAIAIKNNQIVVPKDAIPTMTAITNGQQSLTGLLASLQSTGEINPQGQFTGNKAGNWLTRTLSIGGGKGPKVAVDDFTKALFGSTDTSKVTSDSLIGQLQKEPGTGSLIETLRDNAISGKDGLKTVADKMKNIKDAFDNSQNDILTQGLNNGTVTYGGQTYSVDANGEMTPIK